MTFKKILSKNYGWLILDLSFLLISIMTYINIGDLIKDTDLDKDVLLSTISLITVIFLFISSYKLYNSYKEIYVIPLLTRRYTPQIDLNEYEKITKEITEIEKFNLFKSQEFIQMYNEKSDHEVNWNWQLRDRMKGNLNVISDDDLTNVEVSIDDDEEDR